MSIVNSPPRNAEWLEKQVAWLNESVESMAKTLLYIHYVFEPDGHNMNQEALPQKVGALKAERDAATTRADALAAQVAELQGLLADHTKRSEDMADIMASDEARMSDEPYIPFAEAVNMSEEQLNALIYPDVPAKEMTMDAYRLVAYDHDRRCCKCGGTDMHDQWYLSCEHKMNYTDYCPEKDEHIHRHCRNCGFEWIERPLDAVPQPPTPIPAVPYRVGPDESERMVVIFNERSGIIVGEGRTALWSERIAKALNLLAAKEAADDAK